MNTMTVRLDAAAVIKDYKQKAEKFPRAMNATINQVAAKAKTFASKEIRNKYNITAAVINKGFSLKKSSWNNLHAELIAIGRGLSLRRFGATSTKRPVRTPAGNKRVVVKAKIFKAGQKKFIPGIFMVNTTMKRTSTTRLPIEKAFGPGLALMFSYPVQSKTNRFIIQEFPIILEKNLEYFNK